MGSITIWEFLYHIFGIGSLQFGCLANHWQFRWEGRGGGGGGGGADAKDAKAVAEEAMDLNLRIK
jgi:hypothetical protein